MAHRFLLPVPPPGLAALFPLLPAGREEALEGGTCMPSLLSPAELRSLCSCSLKLEWDSGAWGLLQGLFQLGSVTVAGNEHLVQGATSGQQGSQQGCGRYRKRKPSHCCCCPSGTPCICSPQLERDKSNPRASLHLSQPGIAVAEEGKVHLHCCTPLPHTPPHPTPDLPLQTSHFETINLLIFLVTRSEHARKK